MHPELFEIPFIHRPIHSFGVMMVIGFLAGFLLVRRLSRTITANPQFVTDLALYALLPGVVGARAFYVVHHFEQFQSRWSSVFAVWQGGLEFYGGVILAVPVIILYLRHHKLPIRRCLDILAIGLMMGLAVGRIGCFLNGCCFGKPTHLPWAVRFPYGSFAYRSQIYWNPKRNRLHPQLELPVEFSIYRSNENGIHPQHLKPYEQLTPQQKDMVDKGKYRCLPVHPTELYSSANAGLLCLILYLFWRRSQNTRRSKNSKKLLARPGLTFSLAFILYGITRFFSEHLRDDNPFEYAWWAIYKGATVSQNLGIYAIMLGVVLIVILQKINREHTSRRK
jgi:phosphatidylglycerol:prolipoprotein diacylglycerol transferase